MWTSSRRHVYRVCGIRLHTNCVFSNVLMQNQRHEDRKTSDLSKSDCSVHGRYRQRYLRVRVFNNFVNNVDIEPWSRICVRGIRLHPTVVFSNVLMKKKRQSNRKHLSGQKVIVPYVEDTNSDILFTIKGIEMNFCRDAYGVRLYLPTRFEPGIARNTEVIADRTIWDKSIINCFLTNFEPSSRLSCLWHQITSEWRVFECVDAKPATWGSKNIWFVKKWLFGTWKIPTAIS